MKFSLNDSIQITAFNTPLDARTRVNTLVNLTDGSIEMPYVGLTVWVNSEEKVYVVTGISGTLITSYKILGEDVDRVYNSETNTKGYKVLKSELSLDELIDDDNTIYEIRDNFDLLIGETTVIEDLSSLSTSGSFKYHKSESSIDLSLFEEGDAIVALDGCIFVDSEDNELGNVIDLPSSDEVYLAKKTSVQCKKFKLTAIATCITTGIRTSDELIDGMSHYLSPAIILNEGDIITPGQGEVLYDRYKEQITISNNSYTMPNDGKVYIGTSTSGAGVQSTIVCSRSVEDTLLLETYSNINGSKYERSTAISLQTLSGQLIDLFPVESSNVGVPSLVLTVPDECVVLNESGTTIEEPDFVGEHDYTLTSGATLLYTPCIAQEGEDYEGSYNICKKLEIPSGCVLRFNGGSIQNGIITLDDTLLEGIVNLKDTLLEGEIKNDTIYSEWWNDVDFFAESCSSLVGYSKIDIKHGEYYFKKGFTIKHDVEIKGNDSIISIDKSVSTFLDFGYRGNNTSDDGIEYYTYLSTSASKGDVKLEISDASNFSKNDVVFLRDLTTSSYQNARNYQEGEIVVINKIVDNTIYIDNPLFGTYENYANCIVFKPIMVNIRVNNLHLKHLQERENNVIYAILCKYGLNSEFSNLTIDNFDIGIRLQGCYNANVYDCQMNACLSTSWGLQSLINQYGVFCANSQNVNIHHITAVASNHGVATGGGYTELYAIVNRSINISYCNCTNRYPNYYGMNFHGDTEYAEISHCNTTGVDIGGNHISVKNCIITPHELNVIAISIMEISGFDLCFEDNEIEGIVYDRGVLTNRTLTTNNPSMNEHIRFVRNRITLNSLYTYINDDTIYANPFVEFVRYDHFSNSGSSWYGANIHIDFIDNTFINNTKYAGYIKVALKNPIFSFINNRFYNTEIRISTFDKVYIEGNYFERTENVVIPQDYDSYSPYHIDFRNPSNNYTASIAHINGNIFANDVVLNSDGSANTKSLVVRTRTAGSNIAYLDISNNKFFVNRSGTVNIINENQTLQKVFFVNNYVVDYTYISNSTPTIDYAVYISGEELYIDHFGKDLTKQVSIIVDKIGKVVNKSIILPNIRTIKMIDSGVSNKSLIPNPTNWGYKNLYIGYQYYDTTDNRWMMWNGTNWVDGNGYRVFDLDNSNVIPIKGTTYPVLKNTTVDAGFRFYDTTKKAVVIWDGEEWKSLPFGSAGFMNFTEHKFDIPLKLKSKDVGYYFFVRGKYPVYFYSSGESTDSGTGVTTYTNLWMKSDGTLAYTVVCDSEGNITYTDNITSDEYTITNNS